MKINCVSIDSNFNKTNGYHGNSGVAFDFVFLNRTTNEIYSKHYCLGLGYKCKTSQGCNLNNYQQ